MIEIKPDLESNVVSVTVTERLHKKDYEQFVPEFEKLIQKHGKVRILFDMAGFHGWDLGALWEDIKFDLKHFSDIERIAFVGDKKWEKGMSVFCKPFTKAKVRYFEKDHEEQAATWLKEQEKKS